MKQGEKLYERAQEHLIGGAVAGGRYNPLIERPLYVARAEGSRFWDVDGKEYIDFFTGSGATFLGHNHPTINAAITEALKVGIICNGETEYHSELANWIADAVPCAEKCRLQNSGTEATMGAIRIARAYTGREKILKFEGHFHGMHDYLWFNCSSAPETTEADGTLTTHAETAGVPECLHSLVVVVPFTDEDAFVGAVDAHAGELAAVILEPISYNQGCVPAEPGFLRKVQRLCRENGILLIFDEVLSGFRMCRGGGQEYYGVTPDLCTLAKALGGGVPISAICGRDEVMSVLNPVGDAIISGTYTGHLPAVMAAIACQQEIAKPGFYEHINALAERLYMGLGHILESVGVTGVVQGIGARFGLYLGIDGPVKDYRQAAASDREMGRRFLRGCLDRGLYLHDYGHETPMHHGFSAQHSLEDIDEALNIMEDVFGEIVRQA